MNRKKPLFDLSSAGLHLIAMACMLLDHLWATVTPGNIDLLQNVILAMLNINGHDPHGSFPPYPVLPRETAGRFFTAKIQCSLTKEAAAMLCPTLLAISSGNATFTDSRG